MLFQHLFNIVKMNIQWFVLIEHCSFLFITILTRRELNSITSKKINFESIRIDRELIYPWKNRIKNDYSFQYTGTIFWEGQRLIRLHVEWLAEVLQSCCSREITSSFVCYRFQFFLHMFFLSCYSMLLHSIRIRFSLLLSVFALEEV